MPRVQVGHSPVWCGHGCLGILASLPLRLWGARSPTGLPVPGTWAMQDKVRPGSTWCQRAQRQGWGTLTGRRQPHSRGSRPLSAASSFPQEEAKGRAVPRRGALMAPQREPPPNHQAEATMGSF